MNRTLKRIGGGLLSILVGGLTYHYLNTKPINKNKEDIKTEQVFTASKPKINNESVRTSNINLLENYVKNIEGIWLSKSITYPYSGNETNYECIKLHQSGQNITAEVSAGGVLEGTINSNVVYLDLFENDSSVLRFNGRILNDLQIYGTLEGFVNNTNLMGKLELEKTTNKLLCSELIEIYKLKDKKNISIEEAIMLFGEQKIKEKLEGDILEYELTKESEELNRYLSKYGINKDEWFFNYIKNYIDGLKKKDGISTKEAIDKIGEEEIRKKIINLISTTIVLSELKDKRDLENILNKKERITNYMKEVIDLNAMESVVPNLFPLIIKNINSDIESGKYPHLDRQKYLESKT